MRAATASSGAFYSAKIWVGSVPSPSAMPLAVVVIVVVVVVGVLNVLIVVLVVVDLVGMNPQ